MDRVENQLQYTKYERIDFHFLLLKKQEIRYDMKKEILVEYPNIKHWIEKEDAISDIFTGDPRPTSPQFEF